MQATITAFSGLLSRPSEPDLIVVIGLYTYAVQESVRLYSDCRSCLASRPRQPIFVNESYAMQLEVAQSPGAQVFVS